MANCWHFYQIKLQGKTFRPERFQLQVICNVTDMDINLKCKVLGRILIYIILY